MLAHWSKSERMVRVMSEDEKNWHFERVCGEIGVAIQASKQTKQIDDEFGCPMGLNQNYYYDDEDEDWAIARGIASERTRGGENDADE